VDIGRVELDGTGVVGHGAVVFLATKMGLAASTEGGPAFGVAADGLGVVDRGDGVGPESGVDDAPADESLGVARVEPQGKVVVGDGRVEFVATQAVPGTLEVGLRIVAILARRVLRQFLDEDVLLFAAAFQRGEPVADLVELVECPAGVPVKLVARQAGVNLVAEFADLALHLAAQDDVALKFLETLLEELDIGLAGGCVPDLVEDLADGKFAEVQRDGVDGVYSRDGAAQRHCEGEERGQGPFAGHGSASRRWLRHSTRLNSRREVSSWKTP